MQTTVTEQQERTKIPNLGVVLVDMQPKYLAQVLRKHRDIMISSQLEIISLCSELDIPIAVLEMAKEGSTIPELQEVLKRVPRKKQFTKNYNDGFTNSMLEPALKEWDIRYICLMGINAPYCVKETAESALTRGFEVITARTLIAAQAYKQLKFRQSLYWFRKNGIYSKTHKDIIKNI